MMSENGHDLHALFPAQREILHALKLNSAPYRNLADRYHELAQEISRIESGVEPASDDRLEELKKRRLDTLDEIAAMIAERLDA